MNVVVVFWGGGANIGIAAYDQAAANTRVLAAEITILITNMVHLGAEPSTVHVIGHSLGAHTAGYAGSRLRTNHNITLGRISGRSLLENRVIISLETNLGRVLFCTKQL